MVEIVRAVLAQLVVAIRAEQTHLNSGSFAGQYFQCLITETHL